MSGLDRFVAAATSATPLATSIAGVPLPSLLMNASGPRCTTPAELDAIAASASGAVVTKSCTASPRNGNPEPRYAEFHDAGGAGSINSMGLPNDGLDAYLEYAARPRQERLILSIAGLSLDELLANVRRARTSGADLLEVNLSCPNIVGKPQLAYDLDALATALGALSADVDADTVPFGVKLPPYFDQAQFRAVAKLVAASDAQFVTCINSPGHGMVLDDETLEPVIAPNGGHGGVGGACILPFALANVRAFRRELPERIDVIGCGGTTRALDVLKHLACGASAVQVGTWFMQRGPELFAELERDVCQALVQRGSRADC